MQKENEIGRLERHIERLLEHYTELKARNSLLERDLREQQEHNRRLRRELETLESERGEIGGRVNALIEKIETWQSEIDSGAEDHRRPESGGEQGPAQPEQETGSIGNGAAEPPDDRPGETGETRSAAQESKEDKGGGVQTSLFSNAPSPG